MLMLIIIIYVFQCITNYYIERHKPGLSSCHLVVPCYIASRFHDVDLFDSLRIMCYDGWACCICSFTNYIKRNCYLWFSSDKRGLEKRFLKQARISACAVRVADYHWERSVRSNFVWRAHLVFYENAKAIIRSAN